jgi:hypothetical protein
MFIKNLIDNKDNGTFKIKYPGIFILFFFCEAEQIARSVLCGFFIPPSVSSETNVKNDKFEKKSAEFIKNSNLALRPSNLLA